jgi:hypothetical protein
MIGGTEEDAQRAEELLKALPRESYNAGIPEALSLVKPKLREVFRNMALHFARTGHSVRLPDFPL